MLGRVCFVFFAACSLQLTRAVPTTDNNIDPNIVFPGPIQEVNTRLGVTNDTDPCAGQTFCTIKPDDYPQEFFDKLFKGKIKESLQPTFVLTDNRVEDSPEIDNCAAQILYEPLYKVRSSPQSEWFLVAQAPKENFHQLVRIEKCNGVGTSCFTKFRAPIDLEATCMQKFGVWEFLVYDGNKGTKKLKVDLPSCCSCYYKTKN